jgi:hypothetical protein
MLDFTRISDKKRREKAKADVEFEAMKPDLLGYILDTGTCIVSYIVAFLFLKYIVDRI